MTVAPHPFDFFGQLVWLDGQPLMDTVEPYRRQTFEAALYSFDDDGLPIYNRVLNGRGKKNYKSTDLTLAALYRFLAWPSMAGNDIFIIANDEEQAGDDLSLAKKLITVNPVLNDEVNIYAKEIVRKDGSGRMKILPAQDVLGLHGKTYLFLGFDEIHGYRNYDLFEALSPDPSRRDVLTWITSYAGVRHAAGIPLYDLLRLGKSGGDPRMLFSWYSGDYTTDPALAGDDVTPEQRANPSMSSWDNPNYLGDQYLRLPRHKYRRLHLNLPGAPDGAAFDAEAVIASIVPGRKRLSPLPGRDSRAFVDMSGGSSDDAVLGVGHAEDGRTVIDLLISQTGAPPFNPRHAVQKFAEILKEYRISRVVGDRFAGNTFVSAFAECGITYEVCESTRSQLYEVAEAAINAGEAELPDIGVMQEQFLTLVRRPSGKIDHIQGDHDDWANCVAGVISLVKTDAAPSLVRRADIVRSEVAAEVGPLAGVFAILWVTGRGEAGVVYSGLPRDPNAPLVVLDLDRLRMDRDALPRIAGRLGDLFDAARERVKGRAVSACLWVPAPWVAQAENAMRAEFRERIDRRELRVCSVDPIGAEYLRDPVRLLYGANVHTTAGKVRLSAGALAKADLVPFFGSLSYVPGSRERVEDDGLRMAALLTVAMTFDTADAPMSPALPVARMVAA